MFEFKYHYAVSNLSKITTHSGRFITVTSFLAFALVLYALSPYGRENHLNLITPSHNTKITDGLYAIGLVYGITFVNFWVALVFVINVWADLTINVRVFNDKYLPSKANFINAFQIFSLNLGMV